MIKRIFLAGIIMLMLTAFIGCEAVNSSDRVEILLTTSAMRDLNSRDPQVRESAVYRLSLYTQGYVIHSPDYISDRIWEIPDRLIELMLDPSEDVDVRVAVIRTILNYDFGPEDAGEKIEELMHDSDPLIRAAALEADIWSFPDEEVILNALSDGNLRVREKVALRLGLFTLFQGQGAQDFEQFAADAKIGLSELLEQEDLDARVAGAIGLNSLGEYSDEMDKLLTEGLKSSIYFTDILYSVDLEGESNFPRLKEAMLDLLEARPEVLTSAVPLMDIGKGEDIVEFLAGSNPDLMLHKILKRMSPKEIDLYRIDIPTSTDVGYSTLTPRFPSFYIVMNLDDGSSEYIELGGVFGNSDYINITLRNLKYFRQNDRVIDLLIEYLKSEDRNHRNNAASTLGNIGPYAERAIPALTEAFLGEGENGRAYAIPLGRIGKKHAESLVPLFLEGIRDEKKCYASLRGLEALGPAAKSAEEALWEYLETGIGQTKSGVVGDTLASINREDKDYSETLATLAIKEIFTENLEREILEQDIEIVKIMLEAAALGVDGELGSIFKLIQLLRGQAREHQAEYLNICETALQDESEQIRLNAVIFLAAVDRSDRKHAIEILEGVVISDSSEMVRAGASDIIAWFKEDWL